ncbi:hypothetical protein SAMN04488038_10887 [Solimonas aquatica]|uniref:Uncharacterized protein n=1 Tax=Solimonas aquatica TaxID=489703 RepID=A0A1H9HAI7_9GAMM|nr:hypothetical protein [Solimonas aquatica]SEQ59258.1 hypothetical protein SAMN04488038_10887 [Solimonas aquatica]
MSQVPGGWTPFSFEVTPEASAVFAQALKGFTGVSYTPLAVATQVVAGLNYSFLAKGTVVIPAQTQLAAVIHIYKPLQGDPVLRQIDEVPPTY